MDPSTRALFFTAHLESPMNLQIKFEDFITSFIFFILVFDLIFYYKIHFILNLLNSILNFLILDQLLGHHLNWNQKHVPLEFVHTLCLIPKRWQLISVETDVELNISLI